MSGTTKRENEKKQAQGVTSKKYFLPFFFFLQDMLDK